MNSNEFKIWLKAQEDQLNRELEQCLQTRAAAEAAIDSLASEPIKQAALITSINELNKIITGIKYKQEQLDEYPEVLALIFVLDNRGYANNKEGEPPISTSNLENQS